VTVTPLKPLIFIRVLMPENNWACIEVETVVSASAYPLPTRIS
jgi:hypothetical protein